MTKKVDIEGLMDSPFRDFTADKLINEFNYSISTLSNYIKGEFNKEKYQVAACLYLNLVEIIHRTFRNAYDIDVDEVYDTFKEFRFLDTSISYNPYGSPLKDDVINEALNYIQIGLLLCKMNDFNTPIPMFHYYHAEFERFRGRCWHAMRKYNRVLIQLRNDHQKDLHDLIKFRLGSLYSEHLIKSPLCAPLKPEKIEKLRTAGVKMQNSFGPVN